MSDPSMNILKHISQMNELHVNRYLHYKENYDKVVNELRIYYNNGLWWLTFPNVKFSWQMIFEDNDNLGLMYYLPPKKVKFIDYTQDRLVYLQAIQYQFVINELLGWPDYEDEDYSDDSEEEYTLFDPWCSDSLYN